MPEARTTYSRTLIMRKAWALARQNSRRFGGSVRAHFPAALHQAWAEVRQHSLETTAMLDRVLAEVARIRAEARARRAAQEAATKATAAAAAQVQARMAEAGARPTTAAGPAA
jgi:hypothetical protein